MNHSIKTQKNHAVELFCFVLASILASSAHAESRPAAIAFSQIGAKATADYHGNALAVTATTTGAQLHCAFQKLIGHATTQGLWLKSTAHGGGQLRLLATAFGRGNTSALNKARVKVPIDDSSVSLADTGTISVKGNTVQFKRPGLMEEYSVSVDGVQQDFVIPKRPAGKGDLWVELALTGAKAEATSYGAKLVLDGSDRALAYSRLRAMDDTGHRLQARLELLSPHRLVVQVVDTNAVYPIQIDPTFSDANWISLNPSYPGISGTVDALAVSGTNLYVGGTFTNADGVPADNIARWDGNTWSALGSGVVGDPSFIGVDALAVIGTNLYVGGTFTSAGGVVVHNIAKWDGSSWSALGSGVGGQYDQVDALAVSGTSLYVGGSFTTAGGGPATNVADWNGSTWEALGSLAGGVTALAVSGTNLYAAGPFAVSGANYGGVAIWNGNTWSDLSPYMNNGDEAMNYGYALAVGGTNLYADADFLIFTQQGLTSNAVVQWDGNGWSQLSGWMGDGSVNALTADETNLYAGGEFTAITNGVSARNIAKWNGSTWSALGSGVAIIDPVNLPEVNVMALKGTNLYVGGTFATAGGVPAERVAKWDGGDWSGLSTGLDGDIYAVAVDGTNLYVSGRIGGTVGGAAIHNIAKWNGDAWVGLGSGLTGYTSGIAPYGRALAVSGTNIYVGGFFSTAGGLPAGNIARWDGDAWSSVGSGISGQANGYFFQVNALAVDGTDLYAGGYFDSAGGVIANNVAKWNGTTWSGLGNGLTGFLYGNPPYVLTLATNGTDLYAAGFFTTAGGGQATNIAKWDGSNWSALGSGISGEVNGYLSSVSALAVIGNDIIAGGYFTNASGIDANNVAEWNGSSWSALGTGVYVGGQVNALASDGTNIYAGGYFYSAGNVSAAFVAKWNGSNWSALGSGLDYQVNALADDNEGHLFVGGDFIHAGSKISPSIAEANVGAVASGPFEISHIAVNGGLVTLDCAGVPTTTYALERATDVMFSQNLTTLLTTNAPADGQFQFTDPNPPATTAFYRLIKQ